MVFAIDSGIVAPMKVWSIVVAAGSGSRFGGQKQTALLAGVRIVDYSVAFFRDRCDGVVVVGSEEILGSAEDLQVDDIVGGGDTRSDSVRKGLQSIPENIDVVVVHDGARPLVSDALFSRVLDGFSDEVDGVVPVVKISDTLRTVEGKPVDREKYVAVQTPQAFRRNALVSAYAYGQGATDDATLVDSCGGTVVHVVGDVGNIKVTFPMDLKIAEVLVDE